MPGLEDLYREIILDHYRSPRNRGELPSPPAARVEGFNPLCGAEIVVDVDVHAGVVNDIRIGGQGCSASQSSASSMSAGVEGRTLEEGNALLTGWRYATIRLVVALTTLMTPAALRWALAKSG